MLLKSALLHYIFLFIRLLLPVVTCCDTNGWVYFKGNKSALNCTEK